MLDAMHYEMNSAKNFMKTIVGMKDTMSPSRLDEICCEKTLRNTYGLYEIPGEAEKCLNQLYLMS
jgi:queuine/archaeosine tRNA-ribosyltransferase